MGRRPEHELAPAGLGLRPDPGSRLLADGTVLVGGSPVRVLRLTRSGARQVADWWRGAPVSDNPKARTLARRLLDTGIANPDRSALAAAGREPHPAEVTVVVPVRDRLAELARCLAGLVQMSRMIVVDDGSGDPAAVTRVAADAGARVLHRAVNGGPAAARNTGLAAADTPLVAFLDSDCVPGPGWLDALLPHFADPAVGAVAPRIAPDEPGRTWLARYEGASSTLDMGARASIVRPGSRVPYVPGAALVVRRAAAGTGFAETMRVGEDVDFVWRLVESGWRVRYEPGAVMGHQHRVRLREWFARRKDYGTSAAILEQRHPGTVRPLYVSAWTALAWLAAAAGHPAAGAACVGASVALLARRLAPATREQATPGQVTAGQVTAGQAIAGQATAGQATGGQVTAGQATGGQATRGQ